MTTVSGRLDRIFGSLEAAGYSRTLQRSLLPDWVTSDVLRDDAATSEIAAILAKRLGLRASPLFSQPPHVESLRRRDTKYKRSIPNRSKNLTAATSVAVAVAEIVAEEYRVPLKPFPDTAGSLRDHARKEFPGNWLGLRNLLMMCWAHGVPVVYLADVGDASPKMDGMVIQTAKRPVIVLSKASPLWAWQLFVLAHEVGHIALGHVEPDEILIDEQLGADSYALTDGDTDERAADEFALELLNGRPDASYKLSDDRVNGATLANVAFDYGKKNWVDPGHIALNYAHNSGDWKVGVSAATTLQGDRPPAPLVINEAMWREFNDESFSDDTREFLSRATGTIEA